MHIPNILGAAFVIQKVLNNNPSNQKFAFHFIDELRSSHLVQNRIPRTSVPNEVRLTATVT